MCILLTFIILLSILCVLKRLRKNSMYNIKGVANYKWKAFCCICCYSNQAAFLGSKENSIYKGTNAEKCCVLFQKQKLLPTGFETANWAVFLLNCTLHLDCVLFSLFLQKFLLKIQLHLPKSRHISLTSSFAKLRQLGDLKWSLVVFLPLILWGKYLVLFLDKNFDKHIHVWISP